ncbi:MAG TPA: uracil phosphoribosyltransferase [Acidimicrobiales bacterium]|nr:uracil phosphoribosyltransferase [Acidimicrobiales bacterium]
MTTGVQVLDHPLVQHKLSIMRKKETSTSKFRGLLHEIGMLIGYEVTRDLPVTSVRIETPLAEMDAPMIDGKKLVFISVLRAGNGLVDGMLQVVPSARVGHVGLYRDHETLQAVEYYFKVPTDLEDRDVIVTDPMLATGNSAIAALDRIAALKPKRLKYACLLAAPEGVAALQGAHPDVPIYTAAIDSHLNEKGYIVPGLGDAGDRIYGTR